MTIEILFFNYYTETMKTQTDADSQWDQQYAATFLRSFASLFLYIA